MTAKHKKIFAFSLIELMAALAVVMVLVALALPRYRLFIASSRQAEAQSNLGIIASLQQTYQLKHDGNYSNSLSNMGMGISGGQCGLAVESNELGFRVINCSKLRYTYSSGSSGGGEAENDGSQLLKIYPGTCSGGSTDNWSINDKRELTNSPDIISTCEG